MANSIKKKDIICEISKMSGLRKADCANVLKSIIKTVQNILLSGHSVSFAGLGSFKVKKCKNRQARDLRTGQAIFISGKNKVSFKPTVGMRKLVQKAEVPND